MSPRAVDHLNTGLMLVALGAAFALPFELFLFAYAVLGPLHYLTEISWLSERSFFTRGRRDWMVIVGLLVLAVAGQPQVMGSFAVEALTPFGYRLIFAAFALALVFVVVGPGIERWFAGAFVMVPLLLVGDVGARGFFLFSLLVTTVVHVCVFTGAFILQGALKARRGSTYLSFGMFLACCVAALAVPADALPRVSDYVAESYGPFAATNAELARMLGMGSGTAAGPWAPFRDYADLLTSAGGVAVMRFLAFAYTYHYLNWFSKTSIIGWHRVDRRKLAATLVVWGGSLALYAVDYGLGARWLLTLSLAHVLLEFPLNHRSFGGIASELRARLVS